MICLLAAAALVILPLALLDCMKRKMDAEPTLLPFSTMDKTAPAATSKEVLMPLSTPHSKSPLPPLPQQPHSDGNKYSSKSKTSKDATDKPSSRPRSAKPLPLTPRPEMFNAFEPPRRASLKRSPQMDAAAQLKTGREPPSAPRDNGKRTQPSSGPLGSKKSKSKKKASIPKSRSWKEYPAKPKVTITQSKTNLTSCMNNNSNGIKSALTALSEYFFHEEKFRVLGKVDQVITASDEVDVLNRALDTDQSATCHSPTNPARSPYFDGQFDVWIADRVGSQVED
ncbi:hypothetical protein PRIPAC_90340 [Pristionchus pacificus]|uniref:Uncharacterized protein n=1 Tax=Pristionchus pacificus TaxID=54126 RepID=A0A2A6CTS4_PRIPA|nr:hypothetical protein PRIPAC_90340 [Pristionchus pacificus]|eukprot:PDM81549.1 hypothetical protein PRIPAC_35425 [Pristionchus pacificus]